MEFSKYKHLQETQGGASSFGSAWGDQMEVAILDYFSDKPKNSKIIDIGCGDGRGLLALRNIGFTNLTGVELSETRAKGARDLGFNIFEIDFHNMAIFKDSEFDYLFCSHAIEHSLNPKIVLYECFRIAKNGLFICPIDNKPQPPIGESPHTSNFANENDWYNVWSTMIASKKSRHETKNRLGKEIWSYFYEI